MGLSKRSQNLVFWVHYPFKTLQNEIRLLTSSCFLRLASASFLASSAISSLMSRICLRRRLFCSFSRFSLALRWSRSSVNFSRFSFSLATRLYRRRNHLFNTYLEQWHAPSLKCFWTHGGCLQNPASLALKYARLSSYPYGMKLQITSKATFLWYFTPVVGCAGIEAQKYLQIRKTDILYSFGGAWFKQAAFRDNTGQAWTELYVQQISNNSTFKLLLLTDFAVGAVDVCNLCRVPIVILQVSRST